MTLSIELSRSVLSLRGRASGWLLLCLSLAIGGSPQQALAAETPRPVSAGVRESKLPSGRTSWTFLTNEQVVVGIDTSRGGGIGYFARRPDGRNVLNHFDTGRFVQQSYYGDADGSFWARQPWRYNPVQGGGYQQQWPATTLALTNSGGVLYARVRPRHWATGAELPEVLMEEWIRLEADVARVRFRMTYSGTNQVEVRSQEMPAVFADFAFDELVTYQGAQPWKEGPLTRTRVAGSDPPRNESLHRAEPWAAWVESASQWGVGVFTPGTPDITYYRYAGGKQAGETGSRCSYFAPIRSFRLTRDLVVDYELYLVIGSVDHIRSTFQQLNLKAPSALPPIPSF